MNGSTRLALMILSVTLRAQAQPIKQNYSAVRLELAVPLQIEFGRELNITLKLSNISDKAIRVPAFRSPNALMLDLEFEHLDSTTGSESLGLLATSSVHTTNGAGRRVWIMLPEQIVELGPSEQIQDSIRFAERYPCPRAGKYRLKATYQEVLTAEAQFEFTFLPERDMPRLIEMAKGSWPERYCACLLLPALVPPVQRPLFHDYYSSPNDSPQKVRG